MSETEQESKTIAVVGSRDFTNEAQVREVVRGFDKDWTVISGDYPTGVDAFAKDECAKTGRPYCGYPADWSKGKSAGPERNTTIVHASRLVIAFWDGASRGTADSIVKAYKRGNLWKVYKPDGGVLWTKEDLHAVAVRAGKVRGDRVTPSSE